MTVVHVRKSNDNSSLNSCVLDPTARAGGVVDRWPTAIPYKAERQSRACCHGLSLCPQLAIPVILFILTSLHVRSFARSHRALRMKCLVAQKVSGSSSERDIFTPKPAALHSFSRHVSKA